MLAGIFGILLGITLAANLPVHAASDDQNDFEVQPVLPDNQTNMAENFYDLKVKGSDRQTLQLRIQNFTGKTITVNSNIRNAYTQIGGGIEFTPKPRTQSLKHPLTHMLTLPKAQQTITLGPHEATTLSAALSVPKESFKGMVYGDWHFTEKVAGATKNHTAIKAHYAYSVGVLLQGKHYATTSAALKYAGTRPMLYNKHPAMAIAVANPQPMAMRQVAIKAQIMRQGDRNTVRTYQATKKMIAPNSTLKAPISWNYDAMKPGTYQIKIQVQGQNYANRFPIDQTFTRTFKVAQQTADKLNAQAAKKPKNRWLPAAITSGVLWLMAVGSLIWVLAVKPR
ncbi:DUF916 and DUF3324 domain-containing protein [Lacticaseibacillus baoqingensis]|uniref:DUF916 and DUF3324 domain-containing protein n=1 Tax=Lacticaseibacillus baoqingensis TaxID=2486013 RepID=A0ABW4E620_9LACO|nr:DUF916 and DUF3324 domain-containing protein [Lacticaseibacillus baoqingensis]